MESEQNLFTCTQCGDCCRGYGGTYVTDADIRRIAAFTGFHLFHQLGDLL